MGFTPPQEKINKNKKKKQNSLNKLEKLIIDGKDDTNPSNLDLYLLTIIRWGRKAKVWHFRFTMLNY